MSAKKLSILIHCLIHVVFFNCNFYFLHNFKDMDSADVDSMKSAALVFIFIRILW